MSASPPPSPDPLPGARAPRAVRWVLALLGLASMGVGIVGIWVPGLPTTVFLIVASWLFTRSCPELDRWMRSLRPVRPFVRFLDGAPIPRGALPWIVAVIWCGGIWGAVVAAHPITSTLVLAAVLVGTVVVVGRSEGFAARGEQRGG